MEIHDSVYKLAMLELICKKLDISQEEIQMLTEEIYSSGGKLR